MNDYHWPQLLQELPQASASAEGSASGAASRATMSASEAIGAAKTAVNIVIARIAKKRILTDLIVVRLESGFEVCELSRQR